MFDQLVGKRADEGLADWAHYPPGDVYDAATHAQYFYHRHTIDPAQRHRLSEHGHFHTFMRPRGMPPGTRPLVMPELAIADAPSQPLDPPSPPAPQPNQGDGNDKFSHIIAISLDEAGTPIRLFTTNRWVTGETWYAAEDVARMLDCFSIELARPGWPINRWLCALTRLYRPDIVALLNERDAALMSWRRRRRGKISCLRRCTPRNPVIRRDRSWRPPASHRTRARQDRLNYLRNIPPPPAGPKAPGLTPVV